MLSASRLFRTTHASLFFPIFLTSLLSAIVPFFTNLMLASYAQEALAASISTLYAIQIVHLPLVALAMMAQVHVGRCKGAGELYKIGPIIWQFIWFSLLSTLIVVPFGAYFGAQYFTDTMQKEQALPYYLFLLSCNFLYPLVTSLASFYLGQGSTSFVVAASSLALGLQLFLSYLLIPHLGIMAVAVSILVAQGSLAVTLFSGFIGPKTRALYETNSWKFQPKLFWQVTKEGYLRASNRLITLVAWAVAASCVLVQGGEYVLLLCLGATLYALLASFSDAMGQTHAIIVSEVLGRKEYDQVPKTLVSATVLTAILIALMAMPIIIYKESIVTFLFPAVNLLPQVAENLLYGVLLSVSFLLMNAVAQSCLWAYKDGLFLLVAGLYNCIAYFVPIYIACTWFEIGAEHIWFVIGLANFLSFLLPAWRVKELMY